MFVHLNLVENDEMSPALEAQEVEDLPKAIEIAMEGARAIMAEEVQASGILDVRSRIEICDGCGRLLAIVPFSLAVKIRM